MTLVRLVAMGVGVLALGGLLGWYYFLHGAEIQTGTQNAARGYGSEAPSFEGPAGSTNQYAATSLGGSFTSTTTPVGRLWQVSQVPAAGFAWQSVSVPTLRFVERSSGNVLEGAPSSGTVLRLTNTLRPQIYQALVTADGSILERSIDDTGAIITYAGTIASSTSPSSTSTPDMLRGEILPANIRAITADPFTDTLYYTIEGASGASLVSTNWVGEKQKKLFSSAIEGWRLLGAGTGGVVLLEAPLDNSLGYAYRETGGSLSLLAEAPGLTVLPNASTTALIFGSSQGGVLTLFSQSSASATPQKLSIQTVADKCAWVPGKSLTAYCAVPKQLSSKQFLDDWYKGIVHTSDAFYEIDASTGSATLLYDPSSDIASQLDVENPIVDSSGQYIAFMNATDQSLWILRIAQ